VPIWLIMMFVEKLEFSLPFLAVGVEVAVLLVVVIVTVHATLIMIVLTPLHRVFNIGSLLSLVNLQCENPTSLFKGS
jgi:hypothetical protein